MREEVPRPWVLLLLLVLVHSPVGELVVAASGFLVGGWSIGDPPVPVEHVVGFIFINNLDGLPPGDHVNGAEVQHHREVHAQHNWHDDMTNCGQYTKSCILGEFSDSLQLLLHLPQVLLQFLVPDRVPPPACPGLLRGQVLPGHLAAKSGWEVVLCHVHAEDEGEEYPDHDHSGSLFLVSCYSSLFGVFVATGPQWGWWGSIVRLPGPGDVHTVYGPVLAIKLVRGDDGVLWCNITFRSGET